MMRLQATSPLSLAPLCSLSLAARVDLSVRSGSSRPSSRIRLVCGFFVAARPLRSPQDGVWRASGSRRSEFQIPSLHLTTTWRLEHGRYVVTTASWTQEARLKAKAGSSGARANQRVEIELPPIDASPDRLRALAIAITAYAPSSQGCAQYPMSRLPTNESGLSRGALVSLRPAYYPIRSRQVGTCRAEGAQ